MFFDEDGTLAQDILDAYRRTGFYVFTGVLSAEECRELETEFDRVLDNAPLVNDGEVDRHGRPSRFARHCSVERPWSSDEGEDEDSEAAGTPGIVRMLSHPLMIMDSALRAYGHPDILKMIASVNGPDFVPFSESVFHKAAHEGFPTRWHQDGRTHWAEDGTPLERPDGSGKTHGVNLSVSWSHCTPENGLWVIPGSHRRWRLAEWRPIPADHRMVAGRGPHDSGAGRLRPGQPKLDARLLSQPVCRAPRQHDHGIPQPGLGELVRKRPMSMPLREWATRGKRSSTRKNKCCAARE